MGFVECGFALADVADRGRVIMILFVTISASFRIVTIGATCRNLRARDALVVVVNIHSIVFTRVAVVLVKALVTVTHTCNTRIIIYIVKLTSRA